MVRYIEGGIQDEDDAKFIRGDGDYSRIKRNHRLCS
jgi:hypothetical protein